MCQAIIAFLIILTFTTGLETLFWCSLWTQLRIRNDCKQPFTGKEIVVFLTGISDYASPNLTEDQLTFLEAIKDETSAAILVEQFPWQSDIAKEFAHFDPWRFIGIKKLPLVIIALHNFWQSMILLCCQKRYGQTIAKRLIARIGNFSSENTRLIFITGSIGAAMAITAAESLKQGSHAEIHIISLSGVFGNMSGFDSVDGFYHSRSSSNGWIRLLERVMQFRQNNSSSIARAKQEHKFFFCEIGEHQHMQYLSQETCSGNSWSYMQLALKALWQLPVWQEGKL